MLTCVKARSFPSAQYLPTHHERIQESFCEIPARLPHICIVNALEKRNNHKSHREIFFLLMFFFLRLTANPQLCDNINTLCRRLV